MTFLFICAFAFSQQSLVFPETDYQESVQSPAKFLGYNIGDYYTQHHQVLAYFRYLNAAFPKETKLIPYGETYQKRALYTLVISNEQNINRLEDIKAKNREAANASGLAADAPIIVWLGYNVHGNETSSSEAAMLAAYHFLAAKNAEHTKTLSASVIIIDPMMNPDGRERYISFYKNSVGVKPNPDLNSIEHHESWLGGRVNHYGFDLNRDWTWASQVETQARLALYHQFKPHVFVDFHEMYINSAYFFFPAATPINPYLPKSTTKWATAFGNGNAAMMDRYKRLYYTAEEFDLYYPGYGDSYPSLNGSIGMTYEQAGHSLAGKSVYRNDGSELTLAERAYNHYRTSVSTVQTAIANKEGLLNDFANFFKTAKSQARSAGFRQYVIGTEGNYQELLSILAKHDISVSYAKKSQKIKLNNGKSYQLSAGQAVVPVEQAQYILLRNLMDDHLSLPDTAFYDLSSWSLPAASNVPVFRSSDKIDVTTEATFPPQTTALAPAYGYLFTPSTLAGYKLFHKLQDMSIRLRATSANITANGSTFPAGSVFISSFRNQHIEKLNEKLLATSNAAGVEITAIHSGLTAKGPSLGSDSHPALPTVSIALVTDENINAAQSGSLWYLFDQKIGDTVTRLTLDQLGSVSLSSYSTIILPDDRRGGSRIKRALSESAITALKEWTQAGGNLIGIEGGALALTKDVLKFTSIQQPKVDEKDNEPDERLLHLSYKDRKDFFDKRSFPGAFISTDIDLSHPLTIGLNSPFYVLKTNPSLLTLSESAHNIIRLNTKSIYGYVPEDFYKKANDTALFQVTRFGRGHMMLFNTDPTYRMFTYGSMQLLLNAVYLGNANF
jgi:hypothetical protein